ncbi:MAG: hypothetical protein AAB901_02805, partial [Patescibacteria group bacterium]
MLGFVAALFFLVATPKTHAAVEAARPASDFIDTIGVNIHVGYTDTVYGNFAGIIKPRLLELGVSNVRDGY